MYHAIIDLMQNTYGDTCLNRYHAVSKSLPKSLAFKCTYSNGSLVPAKPKANEVVGSMTSNTTTIAVSTALINSSINEVRGGSVWSSTPPEVTADGAYVVSTPLTDYICLILDNIKNTIKTVPGTSMVKVLGGAFVV